MARASLGIRALFVPGNRLAIDDDLIAFTVNEADGGRHRRRLRFQDLLKERRRRQGWTAGSRVFGGLPGALGSAAGRFFHAQNYDDDV